MPLSDTVCRNAKPKEKAYKLTDSNGLYLLINPTGGKLWRMKYYHLGKEKLLAIGSFENKITFPTAFTFFLSATALFRKIVLKKNVKRFLIALAIYVSCYAASIFLTAIGWPELANAFGWLGFIGVVMEFVVPKAKQVFNKDRQA